MRPIRSKHVRPLAVVSGRYLQTLLDHFELDRSGDGARLTVSFDGATPAIWSRHGRSAVFRKTPKLVERAAEVQKKIDALIFEDPGAPPYYGGDFHFRYCSGGVLPIVRLEGSYYYCLFYREIHPIGWNIANGGTDSLSELLDPVQALEREFSEELIVFNPGRRLRFTLGHEQQTLPPPTAIAKELAASLPAKIGDLATYKTASLPLKWLFGPDHLVVQSGDTRREHDAVFLNITALDCSIEVDRVAEIHLDQDACILHGETIGGELLNSVIGLFKAERLDALIDAQGSGGHEFVPDIVFHGGKRYQGSEFQNCLDRFIQHVRRFISPRDLKTFSKAQKRGRALGLCPVTEGLLRRYRSLPPAPEPQRNDNSRPYCVFLSYASESEQDAREVYGHLTKSLNLSVFFAPNRLPQRHFSRDIDDAIEQAPIIVVFGKSIAEFEKPWVDYEFRRYHVDKLSERRRVRIITTAIGVQERDLPGPLKLGDLTISRPNLQAVLGDLNAMQFATP